MKRVAVVSLVAVAVVSGCRDEATLSTDQTLAALRAAGFRNLQVLSNEAAMKRAARQLRDPDLARNALDVDAIVSRGRFMSFVTLPVFAVRYPSVGSAKQAEKDDRPFLEGDIPRAVLRLLPRSFDPDRVHEARICNVVVSSYIVPAAVKLKARFDKATELLRDACG